LFCRQCSGLGEAQPIAGGAALMPAGEVVAVFRAVFNQGPWAAEAPGLLLPKIRPIVPDHDIQAFCPGIAQKGVQPPLMLGGWMDVVVAVAGNQTVSLCLQVVNRHDRARGAADMQGAGLRGLPGLCLLGILA